MSIRPSAVASEVNLNNTLEFPLAREQATGSQSGCAPSVSNVPRDPADLYLAVLESMEQGIIVWSASGVCEMVNARFYILLNQGVEYLSVGMPRADYFRRMIERGDAQPEMIEDLERRLEQRQPFSIERTIANGVVLAVYIRPVESGGHVVTYTDITETRKNQLKLSETIERAELAERKAQETLSIEQARVLETRRLAELSDWLQCCKTIDELYEIVRQAMSGMFPGSSGQLFIYSNSRDVLDGAVTWGDVELVRSIQPQDCWALRRGRTFEFGNGVVRLPCNHVSETDKGEERYLCLPIIAQGDTVGLLHTSFASTSDSDMQTPIDAFTVAFAQRCAEQISMAIANVKLRDELHEQSTRDPLTGLFNRRYFLECCRSAISQIERESGSLALISFDADNFKSYNDQYGHDAGDTLLYTIGELTRRFFNDREICCRTGGEEFSILLMDHSTSEARLKAVEFLKLIEAHEFCYMDQVLPSVTVSAGVAAYPENAGSLKELNRAADLAMYDAKDKGRNCVSAVTGAD